MCENSPSIQVTGNTIFNVLAIGEVTVDGNDRPEDPPRILRTEILNCPFDDILPRVMKSGCVCFFCMLTSPAVIRDVVGVRIAKLPMLSCEASRALLAVMCYSYCSTTIPNRHSGCSSRRREREEKAGGRQSRQESVSHFVWRGEDKPWRIGLV